MACAMPSSPPGQSLRPRCFFVLLLCCIICSVDVLFVSASSGGDSGGPAVQLDLTGGPRAAYSVPPADALFPEAATASSQCTTADEDTHCPVVPRSSLCFSKADVEALHFDPSVRSSFFSRFDLSLQIESQSDSTSLILQEVMRILLTEIYGYSTRTVINDDYTNPLPRCLSKKGNLWPYIWRTDWSVAEWGQLSLPDSSCYSLGLSGVQVQSAWFVDTPTRRLVASNPSAYAGLGVAGLENPQAWTLPDVVALLEPFTEADLIDSWNDPTNLRWFVPPQCNYSGAGCGIALMSNPDVERTVPLQQVVSNKWKIVMRMVGEFSFYVSTVRDRLSRNVPTLFEFFTPDLTVASAEVVTKLLMPPATAECYPSDNSLFQDKYDGVGTAGGCDFRSQLLYKTAARSDNRDLDDGYHLFEMLTVPQEHANVVLQHMFENATLSQATCYFLRENPALWTQQWIKPMLPRQFTVQVRDAAMIAVYVLLGIFSALSLGLMVFLWRRQLHPVIRQSSYVLQQLMVVGSLLF